MIIIKDSKLINKKLHNKNVKHRRSETFDTYTNYDDSDFEDSDAYQY